MAVYSGFAAGYTNAEGRHQHVANVNAGTKHKDLCKYLGLPYVQVICARDAQSRKKLCKVPKACPPCKLGTNIRTGSAPSRFSSRAYRPCSVPLCSSMLLMLWALQATSCRLRQGSACTQNSLDTITQLRDVLTNALSMLANLSCISCI